MFKQVAEQLGNTPAVCRKCYIHPAVIEGYLAGSLQLNWSPANDDQPSEMLVIEREVIRFLDGREAGPGDTPKATLKASLKAAKSRRARAAPRVVAIAISFVILIVGRVTSTNDLASPPPVLPAWLRVPSDRGCIARAPCRVASGLAWCHAESGWR